MAWTGRGRLKKALSPANRRRALCRFSGQVLLAAVRLGGLDRHAHVGAMGGYRLALRLLPLDDPLARQVETGEEGDHKNGPVESQPEKSAHNGHQ